MENSNKNKDKNNDSKKFWISSIILLVIIIALSIAAYLIYSSNGEEKDKLVLPYTELIQNINSGGELPWDIELDKTENYLLVANSGSNKISIFKRTRKTGILKFKNSIEMESPTCVAID